DFKKPEYYRQDWLVGFGWDDSQWKTAPHKRILDQLFPHTPVLLARGDGHRCWVNSRALELLGQTSETGVLLEQDHLKAWDRLPAFTREQQRSHIVAACKVYNAAGFTHVRDMSCTESLWNLLVEMSRAQELNIAIEENYTSYGLDDFDGILQKCLQAKKEETARVRMKGVKVFFDGSLGSETAYLSQPYYGREGGGRGALLWSLSDLEEVLKRTWAEGLEFSVHVIGDEAAHQMVLLARKISAQGHVGRLNLEHVQILRPETIQMMKPLHVRCHMQPCHWWSDRQWLEQKLGSLYRYVFPWEALRLAQIPISFGCDSPVEAPSFWRNKTALDESGQAAIKPFKGDLLLCHSHPDPHFAPARTVVEDGEVREIQFLPT
ncbi:MAG: amidohydrolase family protein, partial [Bdellovibrio sp.]